MFVLYMEIKYNNKLVSNNFFDPSQTKYKPDVLLVPTNKLSTLIMTDPDAPSGNHIHWIVVNIPNSNINQGKELLKYQGPSPPQGSGIHNYTFLLYDQLTNIETTPFFERVMPLTKVLDKLGLQQVKPKYEVKFQSQFVAGGKKRRKTRRRLRSKRKTRKI